MLSAHPQLGGSCELPTRYQTSIHTGYVVWTHLISLAPIKRERIYHIMVWFLWTSNKVSNIHSYWLRCVNTSDITSTYKQRERISYHINSYSMWGYGVVLVLPTRYQTSIHTGYVVWTHLISLAPINREEISYYISSYSMWVFFFFFKVFTTFAAKHSYFLCITDKMSMMFGMHKVSFEYGEWVSK